MRAKLQIRTAREEDADGIVRIIRDGFDPAILKMFIYGCNGIERYVRAQIGLRNAGGDTVYTVACAGEQIVGCVELRRFPGELFLNYISILSEFRFHGLGRPLLESAILATRSAGQTHMSLDVLEQNSVARVWYRKMGFAYRFVTEWWDVPLVEIGDVPPFVVSGFPQAAVCQREFGFSLFRVTTQSGSYEIGCLGTEWFRTVGPEALIDPAVLSALRDLDPSRRVLALLKCDREEATKPAPPARRVTSSLRMTTDIDDLMKCIRQGR